MAYGLTGTLGVAFVPAVSTTESGGLPAAAVGPVGADGPGAVVGLPIAGESAAWPAPFTLVWNTAKNDENSSGSAGNVFPSDGIDVFSGEIFEMDNAGIVRSLAAITQQHVASNPPQFVRRA